MTSKTFIKEIIEEYGIEGIFDILNINPVEALEALAEVGVLDLERFEQYFGDKE